MVTSFQGSIVTEARLIKQGLIKYEVTTNTVVHTNIFNLVRP